MKENNKNWKERWRESRSGFAVKYGTSWTYPEEINFIEETIKEERERWEEKRTQYVDYIVDVDTMGNELSKPKRLKASEVIKSEQKRILEKIEEKIKIHKEIIATHSSLPIDWHEGNIKGLEDIKEIIKNQ